MKRAVKLSVCYFLFTIISVCAIWFCKSDSCSEFHKFLFQFKIFSVFQGNREFFVNLLVCLATSAAFACLGFLIDYFEKKKERQNQLIYLYMMIRNQCYERLFFEENSYDQAVNDVSEMMNFLNKNMSDILDYEPPVELFQAYIKQKWRKLKKIFDAKFLLSCDNNSDSHGLAIYLDQNEYALIRSIYGDLYVYFGFIYAHQNRIATCERIIRKLEDKIEEVEKIDFRYNYYHSMLKVVRNNLETYNTWLTSRYPYNTKERQAFIEKRDLLAKFYAIDNQLVNIAFADYSGELIFSEVYIVEDKKIQYSDTNVEISF